MYPSQLPTSYELLSRNCHCFGCYQPKGSIETRSPGLANLFILIHEKLPDILFGSSWKQLKKLSLGLQKKGWHSYNGRLINLQRHLQRLLGMLYFLLPNFDVDKCSEENWNTDFDKDLLNYSNWSPLFSVQCRIWSVIYVQNKTLHLTKLNLVLCMKVFCIFANLNIFYTAAFTSRMIQPDILYRLINFIYPIRTYQKLLKKP